MEFTVDVESFNISEEEKSLLDSMDGDAQREWLAQKVRGGMVGIDQIIPS